MKKNLKTRIEAVKIYSQDIGLGLGIIYRKMYHANDEKRKTTSDRGDRI